MVLWFFFDFDGTLTCRDTLMPFIKYVVGPVFYFLGLLLLSPFFMAFYVRLIKNDSLKAVVLAVFFFGRRAEHLKRMGEKYSRDLLPAMLRKEGLEYLKRHQKEGRKCVILSASLDVYVRPWALHHGCFDAITSSFKVNSSGLVSGRLDGKNCRGEEKVARVVRWMNGKHLVPLFAYGDDVSDLPILRFVPGGYMWDERTCSFVSVNPEAKG